MVFDFGSKVDEFCREIQEGKLIPKYNFSPPCDEDYYLFAMYGEPWAGSLVDEPLYYVSWKDDNKQRGYVLGEWDFTCRKNTMPAPLLEIKHASGFRQFNAM
jgi:hypothetical protein